MSREDLFMALRFISMGRTNHPMVEELADGLFKLLNQQKAIAPDVLTVEITEPKKRSKKAD